LYGLRAVQRAKRGITGRQSAVFDFAKEIVVNNRGPIHSALRLCIFCRVAKNLGGFHFAKQRYFLAMVGEKLT
jgi:hypothetical protein